ncbi:MAG TPA: PDZ domain-containing protein, partial [Candidatus Cybelea sp.]
LIANSIADFAVQAKGAFANPFNPANVGGAVWRRFTVTLDYPHRQMLLAKNALFDAPTDYDRSGVFLIDSKGAYTVIGVFPGSPAAADGLAKGDVLVGVNGTPVTTDSLAQLRTILAGSPGTVVHLQVRGASGAQRDVTLKLADYV